MSKNTIRLVFWSEIALLVLAIAVFILPLRFGYVFPTLDPSGMVIAYYVFSLLIIVASQLCYMLPLRGFSITNRKSYFGGMVVLLGVVIYWLLRSQGRTLDFSALSTGSLTGPLVFAVAVPTIQGFVSVLSTTTLEKTREPGD